ncbi:hypothetical protein PMAYCL1PPCAC_22691, partial [Pristionchus mayeri]
LLPDVVLLGQIHEIDDGLRREKEVLVECVDLLIVPLLQSRWFLLLDEHRLHLLQRIPLHLLRLVLCLDDERFELLHDCIQILDVLLDQLIRDDLQITSRIHVSLDVDDVVIVEGATEMEEGVAGGDVREEGVAQSLPLRRALHQTSNVYNIEERWHLRGRARLEMLDEPVESRILHHHSSLSGVDGAEGEVLCGDGRGGEHVEERRLPHVGKTQNTHLKIGSDAANQRRALLHDVLL